MQGRNLAGSADSEVPYVEMVPVPDVGRRYRGVAKVRLGEVSPSGRLRLDSLVRHSQNISNDDTNDADLHDDLSWLARSTTVHVYQHATTDEQLELVTFCGGIGPRWAERRVRVSGSNGSRYEIATLWVSVDPETMRTRRVSEEFHALYDEAAQGRKVTARLSMSPDPAPATALAGWPTRAVDFDSFGHLNNAVYWAIVEERALPDTPFEATVEHHAGVEVGTSLVRLHTQEVRDQRVQWVRFLSADARTITGATSRIRPIQ